jgi:hypothetical protein
LAVGPVEGARGVAPFRTLAANPMLAVPQLALAVSRVALSVSWFAGAAPFRLGRLLWRLACLTSLEASFDARASRCDSP